MRLVDKDVVIHSVDGLGWKLSRPRLCARRRTESSVVIFLSELRRKDQSVHFVVPSCQSAGAMLKWDSILQHEGLLEQLCRCYTFPIEVRQYLREWLEEQPWHLLNPDNPAHEARAAEMLQVTITKIRNKVLELNDENSGLQRTRLKQACSTFQKQFQHDALGFLRMMKQCLGQETALLQSLLPENAMMKVEPCLISREQQITEQLQQLQAAKQRMELIVPKLQDKGKLGSYWQQRQILTEQLAQVRMKTSALQSQLQALPMEQDDGRAGEMHQPLLEQLETSQTLQWDLENTQACLDTLLKSQIDMRNELAETFREAVPLVEHLQKLVLEDEMAAWKRNQQLACNGVPPQDDLELDRLQYWCECLAEILVLMHQLIQRLDPPDTSLSDPSASNLRFLSPFSEVVRLLLLSLVSRTFVLERQPDQVVQKEIHFTASVRLLVARKLNLSAPFPCVKASVLNEEEAKKCAKDPRHVTSQNSVYTLKDCEVAMEFPKESSPSPYPTGPLCCHFRLLLDFEGPRNRSQERVAKIKSCFRFQTSLNVQGIQMDLQTLSLPVVVTVHGVQKCQAVATILWDNAFSLPNRQPFDVPSSVPWARLAEQLQVKCQKLTGRRMSPDHLHFLFDKISGIQGQDPNISEVSMAQFCERPLPFHSCMIGEKKKSKRRCTFWDWFYDTLQLIKSLRELWEEGYIEGFLSKAKAEEILKDQKKGTFLFRFSDSVCGGLSIAFVMETEDGGLEVKHTAPIDQVSVGHLADTIRGPNNLETLYPGFTKDSVFTRFYTPAPAPDLRGYVDLMKATTKTGNGVADPSPAKPDPSSLGIANILPGDLEDVDMKSMYELYCQESKSQ